MNYFPDRIVRTIALILLVPFIVLSCSFPTGGSKPDSSGVVITPGEGDVRYVYLDDAGVVTETDTGRTGLFIENNANAEGVVVLSDITGQEPLVLVYDSRNESAVSMVFKSGATFPYKMVIKQGGERYRAWLTSYRTATGTYDITFQKEGEFETFTDLILNKDIFTLYQDDTGLTGDQNVRLRNITIALGLLGSLGASLEKTTPGVPIQARARGLFSFVAKGIAKVFTAATVVATVVAVIVVPVVTLISPVPVVGLVLDSISVAAVAGVTVVSTLMTTVELLALLKEQPVLSGEERKVPVMTVTHVYESRKIQNGEEFHIGRGQDILLNFSSPGLNNAAISSVDAILLSPPYEPGSPFVSNSGYFSFLLEKPGNSDEFRIRIKRASGTGYNGDGKIAFAFQFGIEEGSALVVNNNAGGVMYKKPGDESEKLYKDIVVVRFCIDPSCPDYVD